MFQKVAYMNTTKHKLLVKFLKILKISWKSFVIELPFSNFHAYKLQPLALFVFKILENSWDNVCCGIPFYKSKYIQVLYIITALNSF